MDFYISQYHGRYLVSGSNWGHIRVWKSDSTLDLENSEDIMVQQSYKQVAAVELEAEVFSSARINQSDTLFICGSTGVFLIQDMIHNRF